jgi:nucleoside-diphosphate-sugar epimerase
MRILVTGRAGVIGLHITNHLAADRDYRQDRILAAPDAKMRHVGRGPEGRRMKAFLIAAGLPSSLWPMTDSTPAEAGIAAPGGRWCGRPRLGSRFEVDHLRGACTALKGA